MREHYLILENTMFKPITMEEINSGNLIDDIKFVKIGGGYRIASMSENFRLDHSDMVTKEEIPLVQGAGTIVVRSGRWKFSSYESVTLKLDGAKNYVATKEICEEVEAMISLEYDACLR
jgi:hypothetical protein